MTQLITAAQMRAIERTAIESGAVSGLELMERAGRGVVDEVMVRWPDMAQRAHRAVVLCGPGNNGGDGFVVARLLAQLDWAVEVIFAGEPAKLPPDARSMYAAWREIGAVTAFDPERTSIDRDAELIVDALFGTGLTRPIEGMSRVLGEIQMARSEGIARVVAVDLPSGLCSDSGRVLEADGQPDDPDATGHVVADLTVAFHSLKLGHVLASGPETCGETLVCDIGLGAGPADLSVVTRLHPAMYAAKSGSCCNSLGKDQGAHKFDHGHALILAGGPGRTGAARLAARGALRVGAGMVTLGVPPAAQMEVASQITSIMLTRIRDADALRAVLQDARITALCLGPALGMTDDQAELVAAALASGRPCVLDADALTLISQQPDLFAALHGDCVLSPHAGEFARIFPDIADRLSAPARIGPACSKVDATREAAARAGCTVVFKGPDTVIASADGSCAINDSQGAQAAPWLATAGSGDVLAGFITGLLARGFSPHDAACAGAWIHGQCARSFGPGLIAEDIPEQVPTVLRQLGF